MSSQKKYPVSLSVEDREALVRVTTTGVRSASMIRRARVLLALDTSVVEVDPRTVIAARAGVSCETVRWSRGGSPRPAAMSNPRSGASEREFPPVPSPVTAEVEAKLIALPCSQPPAGHSRWSLRLLEKHVVLIEDLPNLDHSTISRVLKKRSFVLT